MDVTVTVNPTPTVDFIPNQVKCKGNFSDAVSFTGTGTTYNWTNDNTSIGLLGSGTGNIPSFLTTNVGTTILTATITVTPTANGCTGTPVTFTITVNPAPTVNNPGDQTLCNGTSTTAITFNGGVSGTSYSWGYLDPSIGLPSSGTGDIASFTALNAGATNAVANIMVTPDANGCTGVTIGFTITVKPTPTVNAVSNQTFCNGTSTTVIPFTGSTVAGTLYNWVNDNTSIGLGASGTGDIPVFTAQNPGSTDLVAHLTVTPVATGCPGSSQSFTITINPTPTTNTPPNVTYCNNDAGAAIVFSTPTPGVQSFDWTSNFNVGFGTSGTGNIPAFTASNTNTPPNTPNSPVTATVSVKATVDGCQSLAAANFTVRVNPTAVVNPLTNLTYCNGDAAPAILFTTPTGVVTYDWTSSVNIGFGTSGSGNTILGFTATNATNAPVTTTISVKATANGCQGPAMIFTITVNPTPVINPVSAVTLCAGAPGAAISFGSSTNPPPAFSWTSSVNVGFGISGNGNIPAFTALNATSSAVTATVTVTAGVNGCSAVTTFTVTVNPKPAINALSDAICSYSGFSTIPVDITNGIVPSGTVYTWGSPVLQPFVTIIGGSTGTNQASISGVLRNTDSSFTTGAPHTATYTVTPTVGTCAGAPFQLVITVNPVPPKVDASFFQDYTSNIQQICDGKQVGGGGQNDIDVLWTPGPPIPPGGRPAAPFYENNGFDWDWEYSTGPTSAGPYESSPGTVSTFYQHVMPPSPSVFSSLGDHYIRFRLTRYGCSNYSDTVDLKIVSTLIPEAGGPYIQCSPSAPVSLTGASIIGTTSSGTVQGTWTVVPVGTNGATLGGSISPSGTQTLPANGVMPTATFTPTPGFTGIAKLVLTSNDPDGGGPLTCNPVFDTAYVIVLPTGNLLGCLNPATQWLLNKNGGSGSLNASAAPCASVLTGSDNGSIPSAAPINTDLTICSGAGNFIFNWVFTSPVPVAPGAGLPFRRYPVSFRYNRHLADGR